MQTIRPFLQHIRQNDKLAIRIVSPDFGHLTAEEAAALVVPQRSPYYFLMFILDGRSCHDVDLHRYEVTGNELVFVTPGQIHEQYAVSKGSTFVKLGFDESCLTLLPGQYPFLNNPLNNQKVHFISAASRRVKTIFAILLDLLQDWDSRQELLLAHLNSLLTEINTAYFLAAAVPPGSKFSDYTRFRTLVEEHLTRQPCIRQIAEDLGLSVNALYKIVKQHCGLSPKEYITKRLILEAGRRLYQTRDISIKELAFELGFNDPEYFSRLFRKITGQTVANFTRDLSGY